MSRVAGLFVAWVMALAGCSVPSLEELIDERGVWIKVNYTPSFKSGCIVMRAHDVANGERVTEQRVGSDVLERQSTPLLLRVRKGEGWGSKLLVVVAVYEQTCLGRQIAVVRLDIDLEDGKGKDIFAVTFNTPDEDGDGYVAMAAGGTDCEDTNDKRFPGNREICDGIDNNCASDNGVEVDEGFPATGSQCANGCGTVQCTPDGAGVACSAEEPDAYYQDKDNDGDGIPTIIPNVNPKFVCKGAQPLPNYTMQSSADCDDLDPARSSRLAEVCDAIDNDCDSVVDNGLACGGTLKDVTDHHTGGTSHDWRTVSTGPSGYPVWIAGRNGKLAVRKTATSKFESFSYGDSTSVPPDGSPQAKPGDGCGDRNWTASWVAANGHVFLAGESGYVAIHDGTTCIGTPGVVPNVPGVASLTGIVGFESLLGNTTIYIIDTDGRLIRWVVGGSPAFVLIHDDVVNYYGVHGLSAGALLVAGGSTAGDSGQEFVSYFDDTPSSLHTTMPDNAAGTANAVWMGRADRACAVGDGGLAWRWNGSTTWTRAEASGTTDSFSSVVMRYDPQNPANPLNDQCYVVDRGSSGKLRRLTPYGWARQLDLPATKANIPLRDIAITSTGNIWVVGDDGRVFHYPEP